MTLYIKHTFGFFSCCSVVLFEIMKYIKKNNKLPIEIDTTNSFKWYKNDEESKSKKDIRYNYFKEPSSINNDIDIENTKFFSPKFLSYQYKIYSELNFNDYKSLMEKYFSPSIQINEIVQTLENKYNIIHDNTLAVYYRGTDKETETKIALFEDFYEKIIKIVKLNENIKILLQTDTAQFIDYIKDKNLKNVIIITENKTSYRKKGIHIESKTNHFDILYFLSTILIMSKCKYIICSSGNCSLWTMLYRGNGNNVIQFIKGKWYENI